jgi:serine/threonine-protein kinase
MQPVTEPVAGYGAGAVGGGMLPGSPVEDEYAAYSRRDRRPEPGGGTRWGPIALLLVALLVVAGLVAYVVVTLGRNNTPAPRTAAVPAVKNLPVVEAVKALNSAGFTKIDQSKAREDTTVPPGTVLEQDPPATTTVPLTTQITLTVAKGLGQVNLPDFRGEPLNDVVQKIQELGFKVGKQEAQDNKDFDQGQVISTKPGPGALDKGTSVDILYSTGNVKVPNLVGASLTNALQKLNESGLRAADPLEERPDAAAAGTIIAQTPPSGTLRRGSTVKLVVSSGPEPTPSVTPSESASPSPSETPDEG